MIDHVANRDKIFGFLERELVGPAPAGEELDCSVQVKFDDPAKRFGPFKQKGSGEEILVLDPPTKRYGVGVLYPMGSQRDLAELAAAEAIVPSEELGGTGDPDKRTGLGELKSKGKLENEDDFDLSSANSLQPSSMGVSLLADLSGDAIVVVTSKGGRYEKIEAAYRDKNGQQREITYWARRPVNLTVRFPAAALLGDRPRRLGARQGGEFAVDVKDAGPLNLSVEVLSRPRGDAQSLMTVCIVNRSEGNPAEMALFQSHLSITIESAGGEARILPYPEARSRHDKEQVGLDLLYRDVPVFGTGHGCAADWKRHKNDENVEEGNACEVSAEVLPKVTLPTVTPDITKADKQPLKISMASLVKAVPGSAGWRDLEALVPEYRGWIGRQRQRIAGGEIPADFEGVATANLDQCEQAADRMERGLAYLASDANALRAFQLANEAILLQQVATSRPKREVSLDQRSHAIRVSGDYEDPATSPAPAGRGNWRAFQVAFLLAAVESAGNGLSTDRDLVELIWFPTGGGKTEAYLGLAAFSMFKRRLDDPADRGVHVLMRYTLRLLTTQQFERASSLLCAMERIRQRERIGTDEFAIGIWLGGETTPNRRENAIKQYEDYKKSPHVDNPFLLTQCPWCATAFGRIPVKAGSKKWTAETPGYRAAVLPPATAKTVQLYCPDSSCPFHDGLPVYIVDEDVYAMRPTMVIATIDKFANLTWRDKPRALFNLDENGDRLSSPPGLILQDELHLISGPLGSLAGMFEPIIEELCSGELAGHRIRPKIVCSTATIRRYRDQVLGLYGRDRVALFPPPGLDAGDSFFAVYDKQVKGRMYVGVHAPSFLSYQTEWVRALSALVQAPMALPEGERDPWWTMLMFCNSIRDMGTAHTLLDSDVRDYFQVIRNRYGREHEARYLNRPLRELTGGLKRSEITQAMEDLKREVDSQYGAIDVCLASNIIEVGIDILRLGLMVVAGQPKSTAQYIQVTGRVGRHREKPGLVVTLYGPSKPRDRSHFERFRGYHERLYAQVEPTSVTPFSAPALDRALHAVLVAFARQTGAPQVTGSPYPYPAALLEKASQLLVNRASVVDQSALGVLDEVLRKRKGEWEEWERTRWDDYSPGEATPLLYPAGSYVDDEAADISWATMTSMRNVDAGCESEITTRYLGKTGNSGDTGDE